MLSDQCAGRGLENSSRANAREAPVAGKCAVDEEGDLVRDVLCVICADAAHQYLESLEHRRLVASANPARGVIGIGDLGGDVDLRTAAISLAAHPLPDPLEQGHELAAALRAGIHYFDVTAEQRSARQSLATYHDEARHHGTVVLPAMAFYGGLADLLAAELTRGARSIDCIEIGVGLDYWHPTAGTRETGDRNTARRLIVAEGRLAPAPRPAPVRDWAFPEPFGTQQVVAVPLSEIVTIHRHIAARHVRSFMSSAPLRDLEDPRTPPPTASDPSGRSSQRFLMDVHAVSDGRRTRISAAGRDIYAITAPLVVEACARVLENPPAAGGAYAPAELFDPDEFLASLAAHLEIERSARETSWTVP